MSDSDDNVKPVTSETEEKESKPEDEELDAILDGI